MTVRIARLALVPLVACAVLACKTKSAPKTGPVLAEVGDDVITSDEFKKRLEEVSPFLRARYNSPERKKEFLENLIKNELLAQEAQKRGLDKSAAVQETMKRAMVQELLRQQLDEKLTGADIAEADLQAFYTQHVDDYVKPERVRINHILVKGDGAAAKAKRLLKEITDREAKGEVNAFQVVAMKESADPQSAPVGGDMRYLSKDDLTKELGPQVADAAFALGKPGDKAGPIEAAGGFELVKLQNRTIALDKKLPEVKDMLRSRMARERRSKDYDDFIKRLRDQGNVKLHEDEIARLPNPEAGPGMNFPGPNQPQAQRPPMPPPAAVPARQAAAPK